MQGVSLDQLQHGFPALVPAQAAPLVNQEACSEAYRNYGAC